MVLPQGGVHLFQGGVLPPTGWLDKPLGGTSTAEKWIRYVIRAMLFRGRLMPSYVVCPSGVTLMHCVHISWILLHH